MRELLAELRPVERAPPLPGGPQGIGSALVRQKGLADALRRHMADLNVDGCRIELTASSYRPQLAIEEELFRIAQEALNNVIKHARATQVDVQLAANETEIRVSVRDNGIGFDALAALARDQTDGRALGLSTMRERATALGGRLETRSAPGQGTIVEARVPAHSGAPA
jgi:signal transduction histidine kinase